MAYTKVNWNESKAITAARLNQMEEQYDEAVAKGILLRKDSSEELRAEVVTTFPTAGTPGRMIYHSGESRYYYDDGTNWRMAFGRHIFVQTAQPAAVLEGDVWLELEA